MNVHNALKTASATLAGAAVIWTQLPPTWQAHVPGWVLGVLAVVTMLLPSPVIGDPKAAALPPSTVPPPTFDSDKR